MRINQLLSIITLCLCFLHVSEAQTLPTRALFIGNSYLIQGELEASLNDLFSKNDVSVEVKIEAQNGYTLTRHLKDDRLKNLIKEPWDFIFLQEQSIHVILGKQFLDQTIRGIKAIIENANPAAQVFLVATWPRKFGGKHCYYANCTEDFENMLAMNKSMQKSFHSISNSLNIGLVNLGLHWVSLNNNSKNSSFWSQDGSHPSNLGQKLNSILYYETICGELPKKLPWRADFTEEQIDSLSLKGN